MMKQLLCLSLCLLFVSPHAVQATTTTSSLQSWVTSANGKYALEVNLVRRRLTVYAEPDRSTPLWSRSCRFTLGQCFLADNGKEVAVLARKFIQESEVREPGCILFLSELVELKSYSCFDICPDPVKPSEVGAPTGESWRSWLVSASSDGQKLTVQTTDGRTTIFSFADGAILDHRRPGTFNCVVFSSTSTQNAAKNENQLSPTTTRNFWYGYGTGMTVGVLVCVLFAVIFRGGSWNG